MHNGKNDWQYWTTYIQDKNNTVWEATLNVAESANGVKYLYDISPIKKVGPPVKSSSSTTFVGQPVKSGTSTTGDIVAQNQTESQAQIRSSTLSDRDVLRIAAQMAKNSESMLDIKREGDQHRPGFAGTGCHRERHLHGGRQDKHHPSGAPGNDAGGDQKDPPASGGSGTGAEKQDQRRHK